METGTYRVKSTKNNNMGGKINYEEWIRLRGKKLIKSDLTGWGTNY